MDFTEEEKRKWHAARKAGRDPEYLDEDDGDDEIIIGSDSGDEGEDVFLFSSCAHCGASLGGPVVSEFALCDACDGD